MPNFTKPKKQTAVKDHDHQGELIVSLACDTPERNMWIGVLVVYVQDVANVMDMEPSENRAYEIQQLWYQLHHQWMADICDFAGFGYDNFKEEIKKIIRGERMPVRLGLI